MRALSALDLLDAWERGHRQGPVERALTLLAAACPDTHPEALWALSIGRRDAQLLTLREQTFGSRMSSVTICERCGKRLEFSFDASDLRVDASPESMPVEELALDGYALRFRPPNSMDLAALNREPGKDGTNDAYDADPRRQLLAQCVLEAHRGGEATPVERLPANVVDALEEGMRHADPQADVRLAIVCPDCGHQWQCVFDIVGFFWREIDSWACHVLREVHILARAYGRHEREILALSPARRQFYLEMVNA